MVREPGNHPSFNEGYDDPLAPGHKLMKEHIDDGFGLLFKNRRLAEKFCGAGQLRIA